jgi:DNA primase
MNEGYTDSQVESVLNEIGVEAISDTDTNVLCLCPYHKNTDSPAMSIDKSTGLWMCFAPHCGETGTLMKLVQDKHRCNPFVARRLIEKHRGADRPISQYLEDIFNKKDDLPSFSQDTLNRLYDSFWDSPGQEYMNGRGFDDKTLSYFQIGFSGKKNMVTIPVHDWDGNPVGMVGRSIADKRFKNSNNLPTKKVLFNTHRAKKHDNSVVIVESSMDAMRVHQAGFPCVVATNGSIFSSDHIQLINRYWNEVIIMTDFDDPDDHRSLNCNKCENTCLGHNPGRALGEKMTKALSGKRVRWAAYDYGIIYPHDAKDAGEMTLEEISKCINNSISDIEYVFWKQDFPLLNVL